MKGMSLRPALYGCLGLCVKYKKACRIVRAMITPKVFVKAGEILHSAKSPLYHSFQTDRHPIYENAPAIQSPLLSIQAHTLRRVLPLERKPNP